jgi:hypothetical protein
MTWWPTLAQAKDISSICASIATAAGAAVALYWFLFTRSFKRRIEFDVKLNIFDVGPDCDYVAELVILVNNKGQREHRLYNLWCEVRQSRVVQGGQKVGSYLPVINIVPKKLDYFFVQAGVTPAPEPATQRPAPAREASEPASAPQPGFVSRNDLERNMTDIRRRIEQTLARRHYRLSTPA